MKQTDPQLPKLIRGLSWEFYVSRKFNWFLEETQMRANSAKVQKAVLGFSVACDNYLILDGDEYFVDRDNTKRNAVFARKFERDSNFFVKFSRQVSRCVRAAVKEREELLKSDFRALSNAALQERIRSFAKVYLVSCIPSWSRPDSYLEECVREIVRSKCAPGRAQGVLQAICTCPYPERLLYANEYLDLLRIAREARKKHYSLKKIPNVLRRAIQKHAARYSWLKSPVAMQGAAFTQEEYVARLACLRDKDIDSSIKSILKLRKQQKAEFIRVMRQTKFSVRERKLIAAAREFIFLRTYATEASDELFYSARTTLLQEAGVRLGLSSDDVAMLSAEEIGYFLKAGNGKQLQAIKLLKARKKSFSIVWIRGEVMEFSGTPSLKLKRNLKRFLPRKSVPRSGNHELKGTTGNGGVVIGKARLVQDSTEIGKIAHGDILVTSMTTPDLIAAMEKAGGFVTDEGGMTCHAAIVSRELRVPCVIGTSTATSTFKDGELICVDGDRGSVSRASQAEWRQFMKNKKQAIPSVPRMKQQGAKQRAREIPESSQPLLFLKDAQKEDFGVMGGKAASLAKMISHGIPVPDAFVVTTNLFETIDNDAQARILKHFDRLGAPYVSVRSSATVEDSSDLSFAGQFDTFLNVTKKELLERIRECQRSADNPRVREYCRRNNVERSAVKVAVIVQKMIDSEYSGVLFTANPLNHDPSSMIIEAVAGLGEALVSGIVTPSTYAVNKRQERVVSRTYGTQRRKLVRAPNGGNIWKPLRVAGGEHLSSPRIRKLCKLALRVEKYFKVPVDIEWAIERGRIYILQARPITTFVEVVWK